MTDTKQTIIIFSPQKQEKIYIYTHTSLTRTKNRLVSPFLFSFFIWIFPCNPKFSLTWNKLLKSKGKNMHPSVSLFLSLFFSLSFALSNRKKRKRKSEHRRTATPKKIGRGRPKENDTYVRDERESE